MQPAVTILDATPCQLGEGPTYDAASDTLFWFDIRARKLFGRRMETGATTVHDLPVMASALAVAKDGRQLLVAEDGLHLRDAGSGRLTLHRAVEADIAATRSNDSRVHPSGALWFSTMGRGAEAGAGSIYWYRAGEVRRLFPRVTIPNSICFTADGSTAFFADTGVNCLYRVECDPVTGVPVGEPALVLDQGGEDGGLDGSVMDADGLIWNARWGAACLDAYTQEGQRVRRIPLPMRQPSCPAFVGREADRIVVTSAWQDMDEAARRADPDAGKTVLIDLPVKGRAEPNVDL